MPDLRPLWYREEIQMGEARWGSVAVVCGEFLLLFDLLLLMFTFMGIRDGSWFWVGWVLGEGALGAALVIAGMRYCSRHVS